MKIIKFIKKNQNQYTLIGDELSLVLYDETIIEFGLLTKKNISTSELESIKQYDLVFCYYYTVLKLLKVRRKTEQEVKKLLSEKGVSDEFINRFIAKYKDMRLIDDDAYLDAYIHDAIYLKKIGPRKIETNLLPLGFKLNEVRNKIDLIDETVWLETIDKHIEKKLKSNHSYSGLQLKVKIASYIVSQGFTKEMTMQEINKYSFSNPDLLKKEYEHFKRVLGRKYTGEELNYKLKQKLLSKGFEIEEIEKVL